MNYAAMAKRAARGIKFFSDSAGNWGVHTLVRGGWVTMVDGYEVMTPEESFFVNGVVRRATARDVDGEAIRAEDILGIFDNKEVIQKGNWMIVEGVRYEVADARPIRPSGLVVAYRPVFKRVAMYG